jgi:hypothetical protein
MSHSKVLLETARTALAEALRNDLLNIEDDKVFTSTIRAFVHLGPLRTPLECAREFKISIPAFDRWYRGVSRPHHLMRRTVIEHMLTLLSRA